MPFEIAARTILQLGAELISSDAVAIYELVKNAVDARSRDGVDVQFDVTLSASDYQAFLIEASTAGDAQFDPLKKRLLEKLQRTAPPALLAQFRAAIESARSVPQLVERVEAAYKKCNRIAVSDSGHGMSEKDLSDIYLKIGTSNRARAIQEALSKEEKRTPYLGEKGVGRLSVMRLGWHLRVETATEEDSHINILEIDWHDFERAYDKPATSVPVKPRRGDPKPKGYVSGTKIIISDLRSSWTPAILQETATKQIARMTDPFSFAEKRRFRIRLKYNDQVIEHSRTIAEEFLKHAHATCKGTYKTSGKGTPMLVVDYASSLYEGQSTHEEFDITDLKSMSGIQERGEPASTLTNLGDFDFEIYWFNRQRLRAYEGVGDREVVRSLVRAWAGISLFRDGYRVLPYGDEGDDWLQLDIEAFGAGGYKLNTKQLIGRVRIGRLQNPKLLDQTNRQGLVDTPEKRTLVGLLHKVISERLHDYLNEAEAARKAKTKVEFDPAAAQSSVESLEARTRATIKIIRKDYSGDQQLLQRVQDAFKELKDAHERAVDRISTIEEEKERMTQLAGIGLMVEVIAHELTRATEYTQGTLKGIDKSKIDSQTAAVFKSLEQQIRIIQRRLQILEPLTIPTRQKRVERNLIDIVHYVLEAHEAQFNRHGIEVHQPRGAAKPVIAFVVEGNIVQILENLIANAVYWLKLHKEDHKAFSPRIDIAVLNNPPRIQFSDNGPGIPTSRQETVFEPFFSTKPRSGSRRSGLGLYVARQNAELIGGTIDLVDEGSVHEGRLNTFEITLKAGP
jgi:signal transduction histidine kinase